MKNTDKSGQPIYVTAINTNLRKTFKRIRQQQKQEEEKKASQAKKDRRIK